MKTYQLFINGEWVDPIDPKWFDSENPYSGEAWARIPRGTKPDVDRAVSAARAAITHGTFAEMTHSERGKLLRCMGNLLKEHGARLAETEVRDNGKLLAEMAGQLRYIPETWYYYAGVADKIEGKVIPVDKPNYLTFTSHVPVGVVGALTAWNSPLLFLAWKVAPAIAAGCSVVLKPSEFASASSLEFANLTLQAGFPPGVFNVVTGYGHEAGAAIVEHPDVAKITFTGSDSTGAAIYASAARQMKRVSLELGGKSPNIIFEDANIDAAVSGAVSGIFAATGQSCIAGSRLLVQNSVKDEVLEKLATIARTAKIGDPMEPDTNIGPVTTKLQFEKILHYIGVAKQEGAHLVSGGVQAKGPGVKGQQFVEPTIFSEVTNTMRIAQEEVFGPVLSVIGFDDEEDAIRIANDVIYGLAAGVWTQNLGKAVRMSKRLNVGTVWVNTYRALSHMVPFGGMKKSGIGRENGIDAVHEYLETKSTWINLSDDYPQNPFVMR